MAGVNIRINLDLDHAQHTGEATEIARVLRDLADRYEQDGLLPNWDTIETGTGQTIGEFQQTYTGDSDL